MPHSSHLYLPNGGSPEPCILEVKDDGSAPENNQRTTFDLGCSLISRTKPDHFFEIVTRAIPNPHIIDILPQLERQPHKRLQVKNTVVHFQLRCGKRTQLHHGVTTTTNLPDSSPRAWSRYLVAWPLVRRPFPDTKEKCASITQFSHCSSRKYFERNVLPKTRKNKELTQRRRLKVTRPHWFLSESNTNEHMQSKENFYFWWINTRAKKWHQWTKAHFFTTWINTAVTELECFQFSWIPETYDTEHSKRITKAVPLQSHDFCGTTQNAFVMVLCENRKSFSRTGRGVVFWRL